MAQFSRSNIPGGIKVTLKSYLYEDGEKEGEVELTLGAVFANNSAGSMISGRLAKQLGLKKHATIQVDNPFFKCPFEVKTSKRSVMVVHELLPGGFGLIDPVIVDNLFWELIIGGESMITLLSFINTPRMAMEPFKGPGYSPDVHFMGHNFAYVNQQDKDMMLQHTSIFVLKFDGASRGNPGHSGGSSFLYEYQASMYGPVVVWFDSDYLGPDKTNNEAEYLALILGLNACLEAISSTAVFGRRLGKSRTPLHHTSICICGDSEVVIKQLKAEYGVKSAKLKPLHEQATALLGQLSAADNRISLCWISREENTDADNIANVVIDRELGLEEEEEEEDEEVSPEEGLARSSLVYTDEPGLLSLKEIQDGWGSCVKFMYSFGLKPWDNDDLEEALSISRAFKDQGEEEGEEEGVEVEA